MEEKALIKELSDYIDLELKRLDNIPEDDEDCADGEEVYDQGRWQGQFEMLKAIEKILDKHN